MRISEELIERIKQENDIVDVISQDIRLKKSGRNYFGLCPFHNDKSPSLSVSPDKQIYKCFSCGEAGNVFTYMMKNKRMTFVEAARELAHRANIPFNVGENENSSENKKRELIFKANVTAARYYFSCLTQNVKAQEYLYNRGITKKTIKHFGLGYAPDGWQNLHTFLRKKGFSDEVLLEAGLVLRSEKTQRVYDRFRNRIIYPVFDIRGRVIGFGGRVLDDSKPKYLNSPETAVFHKGINLYGLNFAVKNKMEYDFFIMVEGYMDVISLHQSGITNAVASLGTALTINQAKLLKRYSNKIIISYDADSAGQKATMRGLGILEKAGFEIKVIKVPQGKDPDEFVRKNGREAFLKLTDNAMNLTDYQLNKLEEGVDLRDKTQAAKYVEKCADILAELNPVEKEVYIKKISDKTSIKDQAIYELLAQIENKGKKDSVLMYKKAEFGTKLYVEPAYLKAERMLIKLAISDEESEHIIESLKDEEFILDAHNKIFSLIIEGKNDNTSDMKKFLELRCDDIESSKELIKINNDVEIIEFSDKERVIKDYFNQIKKYKLKEKLDGLKIQQKQLEKEGKIKESLNIGIEITKIDKILKSGR